MSTIVRGPRMYPYNGSGIRLVRDGKQYVLDDYETGDQARVTVAQVFRIEAEKSGERTLISRGESTYWPAKVGDVFTATFEKPVVVSEEDIARGYVVIREYRGRSGINSEFVPLRRNKVLQRGSPEYPTLTEILD